MPRNSRSEKLRPSGPPRPLNPLDCPSDLSLYEWESRLAEDTLAAERKVKKRADRSGIRATPSRPNTNAELKSGRLFSVIFAT